MILAALPPPPMPGSVQHASLRRVVLGSCAPGRAAAWYRRALGLAGTRRADPDTSSNAGDEALQAGDVEVLITDRSRVAASAVEPNRLVLNFVVDDILEIEARLVAMEAIWVRELERRPWGIIGTVLDPDGNLVQIIEPAGGTLPWQAEDKEEHP